MKDKFKSRRFLIVCWTMSLLSFIIVFAVVQKLDLGWIGSVIAILSAVPSVYIGADSYTNGKGGGDAQ